MLEYNIYIHTDFSKHSYYPLRRQYISLNFNNIWIHCFGLPAALSVETAAFLIIAVTAFQIVWIFWTLGPTIIVLLVIFLSRIKVYWSLKIVLGKPMPLKNVVRLFHWNGKHWTCHFISKCKKCSKKLFNFKQDSGHKSLHPQIKHQVGRRLGRGWY